MDNIAAQKEHDMYVRRLATGLRMNGRVAADLPGWDAPLAVPGSGSDNGSGPYVPDIEALLGAMHCLVEVETAGSLGGVDVDARWQAFSRWARSPGRMFLVAVPTALEPGTRQRLARLGIHNAEVITV